MMLSHMIGTRIVEFDDDDSVLTLKIFIAAICITDNASMVFGGSDDPLALGCVYSLGEFDLFVNWVIMQ